jgi:hypothetical protein
MGACHGRSYNREISRTHFLSRFGVESPVALGCSDMPVKYEKKNDQAAAQTPYNEITGHSIERLTAISDGIFAVSIMPFSTRFESDYIEYRTALLWY